MSKVICFEIENIQISRTKCKNHHFTRLSNENHNFPELGMYEPWNCLCSSVHNSLHYVFSKYQ